MEKPLWLKDIKFHPVINLPDGYYIHDFSGGEDLNPTDVPYSVGRYNENRKNMYTSELFIKEQRCIHMGIDIAAPVNEKVYSFYDGQLLFFTNNRGEGNYGPTIVLEHDFNGHCLYSLYGHLSLESLKDLTMGQAFKAGDELGRVGSREVNGGWFPHLHFQLSLIKPRGADMPGVVSEANHSQSLLDYPDPRWVLGPIY